MVTTFLDALKAWDDDGSADAAVAFIRERDLRLKVGKELEDAMEAWRRNPDDDDACDRLMAAHAAMEAEKARHAARFGHEYVDVRELVREPDEGGMWLVDELLPNAGTSLVISKPKVGKSVTLRSLAHMVASKDRTVEWLGRRVTTFGPVCYVCLEDPRRLVRDHYRALGTGTLAHPVHVTFEADPAIAAAQLRIDVERLKPALVIVDTLARFVRIDDDKSYSEGYRVMQPFVDIARQTGPHLAMSYHATKAERDDVGDDAMGSTAYFASIDTLVQIKRDPRTNERSARTRQKMGQDIDDAVTIDPRGVATGTVRQAKAEMNAAKVTDLLAGAGEMNTSAIGAELGNPKWLKATLDRMVAAGRIVRRAGTGKERIFSLPKEAGG